MSETQTLATFLARSRWSDIPPAIRHEGKRALLNWLGCALGGARDETVERALAAILPFSGVTGATLIGRGEKLDALNAALVNALSSNILDYDDTHMKTVIHPTVPVAAAALAIAQHRRVTGEALLHAFILGVEVECRAGNALSAAHYAAGWHITSTCGVLGAAAAAGKLLELDDERMAWALGIAATQASGLTAMMGSMAKSYNMGHAASSGLTAALLAERRFTSSTRTLEAPRGFLNVLTSTPSAEELMVNLGETWELQWNAYKPFPCGIVLHSAIDACIQLREEHALTPAAIANVSITLHPLALELAGKRSPTTGLEGKLSVYHAAAVALLYGSPGVREFLDACVRCAEVIALRGKVTAAADDTLGTVEAHAVVELTDGSRLKRHVLNAIGSLERPMSDEAIERKFHELAATAIPHDQARRIAALAWSLDTLDAASDLAEATALAQA